MDIRDTFQRNKTIVEIFGYFSLTRLYILIAGWLSNLVILKSEWYAKPWFPNSIVDLFFRWDSGWLLGVAQNGYYYIPGAQSNVVFFPLYPLLVKILSYIFFDPTLVGIALSNIATFLAMILLFRLIKLDYEEKIASNSVIFALIFPASFFFSIFYSEGLFLLLSVACFYYARKQRWFVASFLGYLASLTRLLGVFLFIPILIEYLSPLALKKPRTGKIRKNILYLLLIPAGLATYMLYLYAKFGEPLAFQKTEGAWNRTFSLSLTFLTNAFIYKPFYAIIFLGFAAFSILILVYLIHAKVRLSYTIHVLVQTSLIFFSSSLESLPRYLSVLFPIFLGFALLARNRLWEEGIKLFSIGLLTLFIILFVNGYWLT